jgi:Asp/Glu/hydantoin racemase
MQNAPCLGILMLDNRFERYLGDIGNPATMPFPVLYRRVPNATTAAITTLQDNSFLEGFVAAGQALVDDGAEGIVTSCGFLAIYQKELASRLGVPVATSALMQIPMVDKLLAGGKRTGVLTFNGASLGRPHLEGVGAPLDVPIIGLAENGRFQRALLGLATVDGYDAREEEAVDAARRLVARHPEVGAIVLECTNLVPHASAIHTATGLPVYDVWTLISWFHAGLRPQTWRRP